MAVQLIETETFEQFLDELQKRPTVRMIKLVDYGFVGPLRTSTGTVILAPQLRVVATAFDKAADTLLRWESMRQPRANASIAVETIKGIHGDMRVVARKQDLRNWLELEGYSVSDGEWTPEEVDRLLARRQTVP